LRLDAKAIEKTARYLSSVSFAVFRGEPFWGEDRIDELFWRLKTNSLNARQRTPVQ
jgi:hypothetical protein